MTISQQTIDKFTFSSLVALALGVYTSITFSALSHILIFVPILFLFPKINFKSWYKSQWALLFLIVAVILSIVFNQDIAVKGYTPITKTKYYLIGLFSIFPIQIWYQNLSQAEKEKKVRYLVWCLFATSVIASLYGMSRLYGIFNPFNIPLSDATRNTGFFGMVLNFAHNLAFIQLLATYFLLRRTITEKFLSTKFLILAWIVNLVSLYTTFSRGAFLAFVVAVPFIFFKKSKKIFFSIVLGALALLLIINTVSTLKVVRPDSDSERISQWKTAIKAFEERPILGQGFLNFEKVCPSLKIKYDIGQRQFCGHAHNIFLEMLASTGLIGFIFLVLWLFFWFYEMLKRQDALGELMIPLIVLFVIGGMTQATFTLGANLFLIMGLYSISYTGIEGKSIETSNL